MQRLRRRAAACAAASACVSDPGQIRIGVHPALSIRAIHRAARRADVACTGRTRRAIRGARHVNVGGCWSRSWVPQTRRPQTTSEAYTDGRACRVLAATSMATWTARSIDDEYLVGWIVDACSIVVRPHPACVRLPDSALQVERGASRSRGPPAHRRWRGWTAFPSTPDRAERSICTGYLRPACPRTRAPSHEAAFGRQQGRRCTQTSSPAHWTAWLRP